MPAKQFEYSLSVTNTGRSFSEFGWETVDPGFIQTWKLASTDLRNRTVSFDQNSYVIEADWKAMVRRHARHYQCMLEVEKRQRQNPKKFHAVKFPRQPTKARITLTSSDEDRYRPDAIAETFVHDVFLIMNIAAPACCDFYGASLNRMNGSQEAVSDIALSNNLFESALDVFLAEAWADPNPLDVQTVVNWYYAVRSPASQIASNPMERVLFSLLHMAKLDASPVTVIWLFYAFESLLETRIGENLSAVVNRLALLLSLNEPTMKMIKKRMRILYDIRSSFVHGGFEITHIVQSELLDSRISDKFGEIIEATDHGYALLIAAIRKIITNGWRWPKFREELGGVGL